MNTLINSVNQFSLLPLILQKYHLKMINSNKILGLYVLELKSVHRNYYMMNTNLPSDCACSVVI